MLSACSASLIRWTKLEFAGQLFFFPRTPGPLDQENSGDERVTGFEQEIFVPSVRSRIPCWQFWSLLLVTGVRSTAVSGGRQKRTQTAMARNVISLSS